MIQSAVAGIQVGNILEGFMKFDLMVRFPASQVADAESIGRLLVGGKQGELIPLKHLAAIKSENPFRMERCYG